MALTPILDLVQDPPKPRHPWIVWAVGGAIGIVINFVPGAIPSWTGAILFLLLLYPSIAIHELGHLAAAKLAGMDPGAIVIGGFMFFKSGDNWVFRFDYRRLYSGAAKALPPKGDFRIAPFAWYTAGGPLASLLFTIAGAAGYVLAGRASEWWSAWLWSGAVTLLASSFPYASGIHKSDGARLLLLWRRPEEARAWIALLMLLAEEAKGVLPRDWDASLCEIALVPAPGGPEFSYIHLLAYCRSLDLGLDQEALVHLESSLAHCQRAGRTLRRCYFLEAAAASAHLRRNAEQARTWLGRARKLGKPECPDAYEAAIALAEKRYDDALRHYANVRAFFDRRKLDSGLVRFSRERIGRFERECRAAIAATA